MTYQEAKKLSLGQRIESRAEGRILQIVRIEHDPGYRKIMFFCNDGQSYSHKDINKPPLVCGQGQKFIDCSKLPIGFKMFDTHILFETDEWKQYQ